LKSMVEPNRWYSGSWTILSSASTTCDTSICCLSFASNSSRTFSTSTTKNSTSLILGR
jgi:hypothetical protein